MLHTNKDISANSKRCMLSIIKGVSVYKGVEQYLSHVEDKTPKYDFMKQIKTVSTAKRYLLELDKLGINPVSISVRDAKNGVNIVPNLCRLILSNGD